MSTARLSPLVLLFALACPDPSTTDDAGPDASTSGTTDAGHPDAGRDAGGPPDASSGGDASHADASIPDASTFDAAPPVDASTATDAHVATDAATSDAATADSGTTDAGTSSDAATVDAATADAAVPDAGPPACRLAAHDVAIVQSSTSGRFITLQNFPATALGNTRTVVVWMPDGPGPFPVLYAHDGQNLFDAARSSFGTEWELDEAAEALHALGMRFMIVGIDNAGADRIYEYTPVDDPNPSYNGGGGDAYLDFVVNDLKPYIDYHFPTKCEQADTAIMGSSLGGLISFHAMRTHSDVFGRIGVVSPAVWWADRWAINQYNAQAARNPVLLYVDASSDEGDDTGGACSVDSQCDGYCASDNNCRDRIPYVSKDTREIVARALTLGHTFGVDLSYYEAERMEHNEWSWSQRATTILLALFGAPDLDPVQAYVWFYRNPIGTGEATSAILQTTLSDGRRQTVPPGLVTLQASGVAQITGDRIVGNTQGTSTVAGTWRGVTGNGSLTVAVDASTLTEVIFEVHVPSTTPAADTVYISGNIAVLGTWEPNVVALTRLHGNLWRGAFLVPTGSNLEFKITRGTWENVETATNGADIANRTDTATSPHVHVVTVVRWRDL